MRAALAFAASWTLALAAPPLFTTTETGWKQWTALRGAAHTDSAIQRNRRDTLRVEPASARDAEVRSAPVALRPGKTYELTAWVRTEGLEVRDTGRSPIASGAALSMASMPFDVHSESLAGTRDWTRLKLRFIATRSQDRVVLTTGLGGAARGRAWFDDVSIEEVSASANWPRTAAVKRLGPAYRYPQGGWIYLHIEGQPYDRGYQHGYLLAKEIEGYIDRCAAQLDARSRPSAWRIGRTMADALFSHAFDDEMLREMKGIADGAAAAGATYNHQPVDLLDIVAANTITELGLLTPALRATPSGLEGLGLVPPDYARAKPTAVTDRCSSFAATGKATRDGHMVIAHTTFWPETLAEQTNIMLDVQPAAGHRVLMQAYPGGIQSGTDWYQNDSGVVLTETTIRQTAFNREGTSVGYRARRAIQYGDNIDKVVAYLGEKNNGLYTNEWLIGDAKNDEIAMFELGTRKTRLWRSSKNQWFGGTDGFYWGCNNTKDLDVRLETIPDPNGRPENTSFSPSPRDIKWREMYRDHKGSIDESFAALAFRTAPLVSSSAMDAKIASAEMASNLMVWATFGKPNQREWVPSRHGSQYDANDGLYPSGYRLFTAARPAALDQPEPKPAPAVANKRPEPIDKSRLWGGYVLPAAPSDRWIPAGATAYYHVLTSRHSGGMLDDLRVEYRGAALTGDQPLSQLAESLDNSTPSRLASSKGALVFDALRTEMGDEAFFPFMKSWFAENTARKVDSAAFRNAAAKAANRNLSSFFSKWLDETGLPGDKGGPSYLAADILSRLDGALIVYGTLQDAGANRYAAEQFQTASLERFESEAPIRKDFELTPEDLRTHDIVFIGRPESNSALAALAPQIGLEYDGAVFRINGTDHASEYEALIYAARNPQDAHRMVLVLAGNSPLETVKIATRLGDSQYAIYNKGKETASGVISGN
ncbi:MAG: hypothetical protein JSU00_23555 [Acidobacteria bacterium]|nr:hypothetical protein [Acidobacteriota bacterium]